MKASNFQLEKQRLIKSDFYLNPDFKAAKNMKLDLSGETKISRIDSNSAQVVFEFSIFKGVSIEEVPFKLVIINEGFFSWEESIEEKDLNALLKYNAPAILLSYVRSVVSMITAYAGLPQIMIPLLNFYATDDDKEKPSFEKLID